MKIILSLALTIAVIAALLIKPLKKHRWKIMACYGLFTVALFIFYNARTLDLILPFYKPQSQTFYQSDYADTKEYPDALLPYILKDKEVVVPTLLTWDEANKESYDHWQSGGMLNMNTVNILTENGAKVTKEDYLFILDPEALENELIELGYLNDTFRYSFFYNDLESEYGNGFYYYWAYGASSIPFELYICPKDLKEADRLYLMYDAEGDTMYLISDSVYEEYAGGLT